jgi:O-antigen/teichoic acid export membrane protein
MRFNSRGFGNTGMQRQVIRESYQSAEVEMAYASAAICEPSSRALRSSQPWAGSVAAAAAPPPGKTKRVSLRANFAWILTGNAIYAACQWGMLVSIAKLGTPTMVGQFALGLAVASPVFMLTGLQLRTVLAIDARNEYRLGHYITPRVLGTAAGLILILGFALATHYRRDTAVVVLLVGVAKAVETLSDIIYGFWQKHERFDKIAIAMIGRGIGSVAIMAVALYSTRSIAVASGATALYWLAWLTTYECRGARRLLDGVSPGETLGVEWDMGKCRRLVTLSLPLGIVMLLISLNANIPRYFVEHYCGEAALGYFAAMAYVFVAGNTVMSAMGQSAMPRLARHFDSNRPAFVRLLKNMLLLGAAVGAMGIGVALLFGPTFLRLVYRADYAQYSNVFTWLMVAAAVGYVGSMLGYGMTAARMFRPQVPLFVAATASTALSCWLLIPRLGLVGSAYAVLIGSVFSCGGSTCLVLASLRKSLAGWLRS